ncbi:peptidoglycan DD-metalloendopeptidase family protein [Oceanobacillus kapialis]|uniref:Peptidoglycan DD-metalloendopeptidase family protein n=1 Tax=Oceanobacillus kapialis TaxID=481353 RepID=A0ABW5PZ14_9BACI
MRVFVTVSALLLLLIGITACGDEDSSSSEGEGATDTMEKKIIGLELADQFLSGNYEAIYDQFSKSFQKDVSFEEFRDIGEQFNEGVSSYTFISELSLNNFNEYQWLSEGGDKGIRAHLNDDQRIIGLQVLNIQADLGTNDIYTKNTYHMPINEPWLTYWGGTNQLVNYHYIHENQRYAYDLVIKKEDTFEGDLKKNESYFAFGKDVVAPLEGVVVSVENGIEDNDPRVESNRDQPLGNHVIIQHDNREYSVLGHFKQGSIEVENGQEVKAGELLGLAGNSGNSSEPHIHFHVADSAEWEEATSLRIKLNVEEPVRGETVEGF